MPLVTITGLTIRFHGPPLLDGVDCIIEPGQRIGLLGRNGAGKTTLFRILAGQVTPDHGNVSFEPNTRVAILQQMCRVHRQGQSEPSLATATRVPRQVPTIMKSNGRFSTLSTKS